MAAEDNVIITSQLFFVLVCRSLVSELYLCSLWLLGSGWPVHTLQQYRPVEGKADPPAGLHAACHSSVWPCSPGENYNSYTATLLLQCCVAKCVNERVCVCVYFCATAETTPNLNVGEVLFNEQIDRKRINDNFNNSFKKIVKTCHV